MPIKYLCDGCSAEYLKKEMNTSKFRTNKDSSPENNEDFMFCNECYDSVLDSVNTTIDSL